MKKSYSTLFFIGLSVLLAVADQVVKWVLVSNFRLGESVVVIPGFFSITYLRNRGGAFSLLSGMPPIWGRVFFIVATIGALIFVFYLYRFNPPQNRWSRLSLFLIFGGGLGNLIDRVVTGEVVDFLLFYYRSYYWPAFNLADSCISVGVALLAVDIFRDSGGEPAERERMAGDTGNG